jgi:DNA-binding NtrC family response regulator
LDQKDTFTKIAYITGRPSTINLKKCKIVVDANGGPATEYIFDQDTIKIGSLDDNDVVLDSDTVAAVHAEILQEGSNYIIKDCEGTSGTYVNRVRIREAFLKPGCSIQVGGVGLTFLTMDERVEIMPSTQESFGDIVGKSVRMREIFGVLEKISPTNATVIIEGETGTGKEVVARTIHAKSARSKMPFIVFDCGAVPENLIESELFGHEKGSFTGAVMSRQGLFEMAQGGTMFLDEIGELSMDLQPKLLRVLEQREIRRVGSNKSSKVDVRVVAATHRNLEQEVKAGRFREDLFYRLAVVRLILPPLRDRVEDVPLLIRHFLRTSPFNRLGGEDMRVKGVSKDAMDALLNYKWQGNIRELLNVIERACSFADGDYINLEDIPEHISGMGVVRRRSASQAQGGSMRKINKTNLSKEFKEAKEEWVSQFEKDYILQLLQKNSMNISQASKEADIDRKYFKKLMKKYEIVAKEE